MKVEKPKKSKMKKKLFEDNGEPSSKAKYNYMSYSEKYRKGKINK